MTKINLRRFREEMVITHRGWRGRAILQTSSYWEKGRPLRIDLAPEREITAAIRSARVRNMASAQKAFFGILPRRFAERWLESHAPAAWDNDSLARLEKQVHEWTMTPADTEGYEKAEVTAAGVDTH